MKDSGKKLFSIIQNMGYDFKDLGLLNLAFTHSSVAGTSNNQRLEFLGDAVLNLVIAEYLLKQDPKAQEGYLTRIRSHLVNEATLVELAKYYAIFAGIQLGVGELKTQGGSKASILADTLEAIIGAIYLDLGNDFAILKTLIIGWYTKLGYFDQHGQLQLANFNMIKEAKDPKTALQEFFHAAGESLPIYEIVELTGKPHKQVFKVSCTFRSGAELQQVFGVGTSRKRAEQAAAKQALALLG